MQAGEAGAGTYLSNTLCNPHDVPDLLFPARKAGMGTGGRTKVSDAQAWVARRAAAHSRVRAARFAACGQCTHMQNTAVLTVLLLLLLLSVQGNSTG